MRIGQRLALRFTLVSALLTGAILIFIYTVTRGFVHADFNERLTQQSSLEVLHYATPHVREVIPPGSYLLVNPSTSIFSQDGTLLYKDGNYSIEKTWVQYLKTHESFNAERGSYSTVGRKYTIEGKTYLVFVSDKDLPGQHELDILQKAIGIGWILSLVLSYLAGLYFASDALQPVKRVVREVNQVTKDNLGHRLHENNSASPDEMDELVQTFNALLERIESAFVAQKRFLQHASHELKTPITAIMGEAELALVKERSVEEYKRTLSVVVGEAERLIAVTQGLLMLARLEEGYLSANMEAVGVTALVYDSANALKSTYPNRQIRISSGDFEPTITGNKQLLQIAFTNLLDNALKYSQYEVTVLISGFDSRLRIQIVDTGIGIPPDELSKVKSALFRASNTANVPGAGLGLSLVQRILDIHAATFDIQSHPGEGTTCTLVFSIRTFGEDRTF